VNSVLVKRWAITVAAAFFGFSLSTHSVWLPAAGFVPTLAFWAIDTTYLRSERLFRVLYEQVRIGDELVGPFFMAATAKDFVRRVAEGETVAERAVASWRETALAHTLSFFYGTLLVANGFFFWLADLSGQSASKGASHASLGVLARLADAFGNPF
jgi:hypothetical protein